MSPLITLRRGFDFEPVFHHTGSIDLFFWLITEGVFELLDETRKPFHHRMYRRTRPSARRRQIKPTNNPS